MSAPQYIIDVYLDGRQWRGTMCRCTFLSFFFAGRNLEIRWYHVTQTLTPEQQSLSCQVHFILGHEGWTNCPQDGYKVKWTRGRVPSQERAMLVQRRVAAPRGLCLLTPTNFGHGSHSEASLLPCYAQQYYRPQRCCRLPEDSPILPTPAGTVPDMVHTLRPRFPLPPVDLPEFFRPTPPPGTAMLDPRRRQRKIKSPAPPQGTPEGRKGQQTRTDHSATRGVTSSTM